MPPIAYLEEASVVDFCGHKRLRGLVFGHPNFEDGTDILTSKIVGISKDATTAYTNDDFIYRAHGVQYHYLCNAPKNSSGKDCPCGYG